MKQRKVSKSLVNQKVREYTRHDPQRSGLFRLYREFFAIQRKYLAWVVISGPELDELQIKARVEEGIPLIERDRVQIDYELFFHIYEELREILLKRSEAISERNMALFHGRVLQAEDISELGEAFVRGEEEILLRKAGELEVDFNVLHLLLHTTLAVFFQKMAEMYYKKADLDQVPSGTCPVCGGIPIMGFNRDGDGLRVLECSLCGTRWGAPRMMCLFCGNVEQNELGYFFVEGERQRRVYTCEKCKRYIKITDRYGEPGEIILPLEDLFTTYLDRLAQDRGYVRACNSVFS